MTSTPRTICTVGAIIGIAISSCTWAGALRVQGLVGATKIDEDEIEFSEVEGLDPNAAEGVDLSTMFTVGAAGQYSLTGLESTTQVGIEFGLLVSYAADDRDVRSVGNTTVITIDNSLLLGDIFLGAFVSQEIADSFRIYAAAGPLLMLGRIDGDFDSDDSQNTLDDSETATGGGGYVRAGVELNINQGGAFGLGVRAFTASLDFDDTLGEVDFEGVQGFLSFTQRF
jgi:hypothetical protein